MLVAETLGPLAAYVPAMVGLALLGAAISFGEVDFALVQELFKNEDPFHGSTCLSLGEDGRLRMGPVWVFDIAMGDSDYRPSSRLRGWMLRHRDWAERMYRDRGFTRRMARRWRELRRQRLRREVHASSAAAGTPFAARSSRASAAGRCSTSKWPNPRAHGGHRAEVRFLRSWLDRRIRWIDRNVGRL